MKKVELQFMVVPEQLQELAYVPDAIRVKILNPKAKELDRFLGDSGRRLAQAGVHFYFQRDIAIRLIFLGIAEEINRSDFQVSLEAVNKNAREIWGTEPLPPADWKQSEAIAVAIGVPLHEDRLEKL